MIVGHIDKCKASPVNLKGITGMSKQVPISHAEGWKDYVLRVFTLEPGCSSPRHRHPWPHINWIVSGEGLIHLDGADHAVREGSYAYIPGEALHQFTNSSSEPFVFICVVPPEGDQ